MRVVHNNYYIDIPNEDPTYRPLESLPFCDLLVAYYGDKFSSFDRSNTYYELVKQMFFHYAVDVNVFKFLSNCIVPDVIDRLSSRDLITCLDNGVVFSTGTKKPENGQKLSEYETVFHRILPDTTIDFSSHKKILSYQTIENLTVNRIHGLLFDEDISKFCNLRRLYIAGNDRVSLNFLARSNSLPQRETMCDGTVVQRATDTLPHRFAMCDTMEELDISRTYVSDEFLQYFRNLKKLSIVDNRQQLLWFLNVNHPICDTLVELRAGKTAIRDEYIQHLRNLRRLSVRSARSIRLGFINPSHPWCDTLEELDVGDTIVEDGPIQHLRSLSTLIACENKILTLEFLTPGHPLCGKLRNLNIESTHIVSGALANLRNVTNLNVSKTTISLSFLQDPARHPLSDALIDLEMNETSISDATLQTLSNLRRLQISKGRLSLNFLTPTHPLCDSLESLELRSTWIPMSNLQHLRGLKKLTMSFMSIMYGESTFPMFQTIEELHIDHNRTEIVCLCRNLRKLTIRHSTGIFSILPDHPLCDTLEELDIVHSSVEDRAIEHLRNLRYLRASSYVTLKFLTPSHPLCITLRVLEGDKSGISPDAIRHLRMLKPK